MFGIFNKKCLSSLHFFLLQITLSGSEFYQTQ
jgi:hypothetical protein